MSDAAAEGPNAILARLTGTLKRGEIALALGVVSILVVLILPMPTWLLDTSLAFSMTLAVLILMVALFIERPLDFSAFPTVLLIATMMRLALNLATTRLILSHGHEGTKAAGHVIEAFGNFVMGGNFVIGVAQKNLTFAQATHTYTLLTVGDGLVSQIPALIISTAAGMLVSKGGASGSTDKALFGQLTAYPAALGLCSFLMVMMALLPGIPMLPFLALGGITGYAAYKLAERKEQKVREVEAEEARAVAAATPVAEEPISSALSIDALRLELGYGLLALINSDRGHRLTDQIKALRRQLATEMGFVMPSVRIQDNLQLPPNTYVIRVKEIEAGRGDLRPNMLLVMDPRGDQVNLPGEATVEPTFGLPALWAAEAHREEATFRGYTVVEPQTVVTTHLTEVIKDNMAELLSYAETQKLLDDLDKPHQKLIADLVPAQITVGGIQRVLQNLLSERISIRDLPTVLEGVAEACGYSRNVSVITEHVRARLARQISESHTSEQGFIPLVTLSPAWEQNFAEAVVGQGDDKQLAMSPSKLQEFIATVRQVFDRHAMMGETPVLLTSPGIRPYVRSIVERFRPLTTVMSQNEIHAKARIKTLAQI